MIESRDKKDLMASIKRLDKRSHLDLFNLFIRDKNIITVANDRVFFDLNDLDEKTFLDMSHFVKEALQSRLDIPNKHLERQPFTDLSRHATLNASK